MIVLLALATHFMITGLTSDQELESARPAAADLSRQLFIVFLVQVNDTIAIDAAAME